MDLSVLRGNREALLQELRAAGTEIRGEGREIKCPFHEDKTPSAGVYLDAGVWRYKCHAQSCGVGGDVFDIMALTMKRPVEEVVAEYVKREGAQSQRPTPIPPVAVPQPPVRSYPTLEALKEAVEWTVQDEDGKVVATYTYADPSTKHLDLVIHRVEFPTGKKTFRQSHQTASGYVMKAPAGAMPIYNRTRIQTAPFVVVVEGEKCVHCLQEIGVVATTSPGGAGKAAAANWQPLAGKTVYLWPDCDPEDPKTKRRTGILHMKDVAAELEKLNPRPDVRWIDCDQLGLPPKGDVVDYLAATPAATKPQKRLAIDAVLEFAEPLGPAGELKDEVEAAIAGKRRPVDFPWEMTSRATRALVQATVTILCGPPGAAKSFWLLQALAHWHVAGIRVAVLEMEGDRIEHLLRAVAQREGNSEYVKSEWQEAHPAEARAITDRHTAFASTFGRCIETAPVGELKPELVMEWMKAKAADGCRVIAVDPITAMEAGERSWMVDHRIVILSHQLASQYGLSVILVTHPKKGNRSRTGNDLDDIAGGAAYQRFSHTVLWLQNLKEEKEDSFNVTLGVATAKYDRLLHIQKSRKSWGQWKSVGFMFDRTTLRCVERGILVKRD